jgi:hypothetical protein
LAGRRGASLVNAGFVLHVLLEGFLLILGMEGSDA